MLENEFETEGSMPKNKILTALKKQRIIRKIGL
jgi:hypothetical protein